MQSCNACQETLPAGSFRVARQKRRDGTTYEYRRKQCRDCERDRHRKRYWDDPEKARKYASEWGRRNRDRISEREKEYRAQNRERYLSHYSRRYWSDPEKHREESRKNKLQRRGIDPGEYTKREIAERDDHTCQICGRELDYRDITIDHIQPLSKGGPDRRHNVQAACFPCNLSKNDGRRSKHRP